MLLRARSRDNENNLVFETLRSDFVIVTLICGSGCLLRSRPAVYSDGQQTHRVHGA
jgi:hypothetical protein